jgi:hypothetical protein
MKQQQQQQQTKTKGKLIGFAIKVNYIGHLTCSTKTKLPPRSLLRAEILQPDLPAAGFASTHVRTFLCYFLVVVFKLIYSYIGKKNYEQEEDYTV